MTKAERVTTELAEGIKTWDELLIEAGEIAEPTDQDYANERTEFTYQDGSICVFHGLDQSIVEYTG